MFKCPVYSSKALADILNHPHAYRMPAMTEIPIPNTTVMLEGQKLRWKEFEITFYYFPGQTLYHEALLVKHKNGESILFIGDSFSPSGMDDYCLLNRNFIHPGKGYLYCLNFLRKLPENTWLIWHEQR